MRTKIPKEQWWRVFKSRMEQCSPQTGTRSAQKRQRLNLQTAWSIRNGIPKPAICQFMITVTIFCHTHERNDFIFSSNLNYYVTHWRRRSAEICDHFYSLFVEKWTFTARVRNSFLYAFLKKSRNESCFRTKFEIEMTQTLKDSLLDFNKVRQFQEFCGIRECKADDPRGEDAIVW